MSNSLRDQLLGLGFKTPAKPEKPEKNYAKPRAAETAHKQHKPAARPHAAHPAKQHIHKKPAPKSQEEIDLAKAYALRSDKEKQERIEAERLKQEDAKRKRELKAKVQLVIKDKALNVEAAEQVRHFEYNGKIRRVYVTPEQLKEISTGSLGIVQFDGRYLIVPAQTANEIKQLLPSLVAVLIDPDAPKTDDPYSDPAYHVPDDLMW
jgi:uncharacterized protein YaiL (DUF2058 family)